MSLNGFPLPDGGALVRTAQTYARDLFERVVTSAAYGFVAAFVPAQAADASMWYAALGAGLGAALSLLKGMVARAFGDPNSASLRSAASYAADLWERVAASAAAGFLAAFVPAQATDVSMWYSALGAGVGGVLAVLKGMVARASAFGGPGSASLSGKV
ncbi:hypothetical protein [Streptomyces sp. KAU_LT]|uniref:hypothetical protein n=1 Tax=Streptomyces sp. KAU_LT TaxID=3046669 RepID=UPI0024B78CE6|nr:hypothetical protein [Streptomyces sp. KAU_LT]MDI9829670.1 hypothetical protein [Streptomyces sp. KAU_LT]